MAKTNGISHLSTFFPYKKRIWPYGLVNLSESTSFLTLMRGLFLYPQLVSGLTGVTTY